MGLTIQHRLRSAPQRGCSLPAWGSPHVPLWALETLLWDGHHQRYRIGPQILTCLVLKKAIQTVYKSLDFCFFKILQCLVHQHGLNRFSWSSSMVWKWPPADSWGWRLGGLHFGRKVHPLTWNRLDLCGIPCIPKPLAQRPGVKCKYHLLTWHMIWETYISMIFYDHNIGIPKPSVPFGSYLVRLLNPDLASQLFLLLLEPAAWCRAHLHQVLADVWKTGPNFNRFQCHITRSWSWRGDMLPNMCIDRNPSKSWYPCNIFQRFQVQQWYGNLPIRGALF